MLSAIIIFLILGLGFGALSILVAVNLPAFQLNRLYKKFIGTKNWVVSIMLAAVAGLFVMSMFIFIVLLGGGLSNALNWTAVCFGGFAFGGGIFFVVDMFILRYYKPIPEQNKLQKRIFLGLYYASYVLVLLGVTCLLEGMTPLLTFPLVNGFSINNDKFWVTPDDVIRDGAFTIRFYGLFILTGFVIVYRIGDHKMYQQYGKHGLLDSTLIVALVSGIAGARLWYCIAEGVPFLDAAGNPQWITGIMNGGLAVQGGVIAGILFCALWFKWRNPQYKLFVVADIVIPAILIAQAIGRWGNFFNQEVYGGISAAPEVWNVLLPSWLYNNMVIGGLFRVPFFLIESTLNLVGYVLICVVIKRLTKRWWCIGDGAGLYFIWYGVVRAIMEPLRDPKFIMSGSQGNTPISLAMSIVFIVAGVLFIIGNHLIRYFYEKKKSERRAKLQYDNVIFDFDGTLVNSDIMLYNTFNLLYRKYKPEETITPEETQEFSGPPMAETLKKLFPDQDQELMMNEYKRLSAIREEDVVLYPNVINMLKTLRRNDVVIALFTNKSRSGVLKQMKQLKIDKYFSLVVAQEDLKEPKPSPDGINQIIEKLGLDISRTLFVGDSLYDYQAGQAAGIDTAIVQWSPRLDSTWAPQYIINDAFDVVGVVNATV